ncbi:DUF3352 domain-containing protein [Croceivirga sp. JEA036]|uniref:DUF3352 domain-containing protein n=1 Tax=Croceivirga sp. JEA036 TaxID=2721162 RepID=UPI001438DE76|nr:DUF3352 domain-containing protein [Croceivirga sp. JEA036]NJB37884.1 ribonuclease HII [Croceivirga sp. JEA036]
MRAKATLVICLLLSIACKKQLQIKDALSATLPQDASVFVKINNLDNLKSELKNSSILTALQSSATHNSIVDKIAILSNAQPKGRGFMGFYELGRNNFEFLYATKKDSSFFSLASIKNKTIEKLQYEGHEILHYTLDGEEGYLLEKSSYVIVSSSKLLIENLARASATPKVDPILEKLYTTSDDNKAANFFINLKKSNSLTSSLIKNSYTAELKNFADWLSLDLNSSQEELSLSGILKANDSIKNYVNLFKGTSPVTSIAKNIAPQHTDIFISYTFNDYQKLIQNQRKFLDKKSFVSSLSNIEEIAIIRVKENTSILLNSSIGEGLSQTVDSLRIETTNYQGVEIIKLSKPDFITTNFQPIIKNFEANYCSIFDNSFLFAENEETLQTLIANVKNGNVLANNPNFTQTMEQLATEASITYFATPNGIKSLANTYLLPDKAKEISEASIEQYFASQINTDQGFYHFNIIASNTKKVKVAASVAPVFTLELDSDLHLKPQFVKNHRNNTYEIVTQDIDNNLYLISPNGKLLWKKQLEGKVQGEIQQVDLYKNGKLQMAFCTNNQFLILDRNGEEVGDFNKKFEGGNLNPLAVFDYDNNRNYRFVVTQGQSVYMYNNQNKIVDGFTFTKADKTIIQAPKHFRISGKDYLLFPLADGTLKILHRAGQDRLNIKEKIDFSKNEVYLYKNKFTTTNTKGVLHLIDTKGKLSASNLNLGADHGIDATSKTLAYMDENVLSIKGKKVELDLGVYSKPKIFYINNKIYVTVTDLQSQQVYLFDSQAKPIPNFPVYGSSQIDLIDMDKDNVLEFVSKDQENSIIVYKLN